MVDIIIIGAGVSGCAIARELSRKKASIVVVERAEDVCCGTSKANSAIVHAGYDATHGSLMAKLNVLGSEMMPGLSKELDFHYKQNGSLVVMLDEADRPNLVKLYENGVKNGVNKSGRNDFERGKLDAVFVPITVNGKGIMSDQITQFRLSKEKASWQTKDDWKVHQVAVHDADSGILLGLHTTKPGDISFEFTQNRKELYFSL